MRKLKSVKIKLEEKIKDLIFKNLYIRRARSFFNNIFIPYFVKILFAVIILFTAVIFVLNSLKPELVQNIKNKSSDYLFQIISYEAKFTNISVIGAKRSSELQILNIAKEEIEKSNLNNQKELLRNISQKIKKSQPWIKEIAIFRILPDKLNIAIKEYVPFALWQDRENKYIIDKFGDKVKVKDFNNFSHLIVLSGKNASYNINSLFNILTTHPEISSKIYSASWVSNRRWNIRFENGILVKLPSSYIDEAWSELVRLFNIDGATYNLKIIDLRIKDKTYLEYKE